MMHFDLINKELHQHDLGKGLGGLVQPWTHSSKGATNFPFEMASNIFSISCLGDTVLTFDKSCVPSYSCTNLYSRHDRQSWILMGTKDVPFVSYASRTHGTTWLNCCFSFALKMGMRLNTELTVSLSTLIRAQPTNTCRSCSMNGYELLAMLSMYENTSSCSTTINRSF